MTQQTHFDLPADPTGYGITYTDGDSGDLLLVRLRDQKEIGTYPTREAAVAAALKDADD